MVHTLKRIYLYTAATFALLVTAGVTVYLLYLLLQVIGLQARYLPYDGSPAQYSPPPEAQTIEQGVLLFVVVALLVGLLFGGGHYWLIRRDARSDPGADGGATRHLFLNGLMALSLLFMVSNALIALSDIDQSVGSVDTALQLAFVLVSGLLFGLVAWERARVPPAGRAATIIRQIQENGVQAVLVAIASAVLFSGISNMIGWALVNGQVAQAQCYYFAGPASAPAGFCPPPPVLSPLLQILFIVAAWGLYVWLGAWSRGSVLQRVVWYAAFGYGLIWLLIGVAMGVYTGAAVLFGVSDAWQNALNAFLPFVGVLITGALIAAPYFIWLRQLAAQMPARQEAMRQGMLAIPAALSAGYFLAGIILLLQGVVEQVIPAGNQVGADGWATAVGALVAGLGYPFLWLIFRRASDPARPGPIIPRRAYVLVILAATGIGAVIAAVVTAYQIAAIFLSLPAANALTARQAAVVLLVLGVMALAHLWRLRADLRATRARAAASPAPEPAPAWTNAPTEPSALAALGAEAPLAPSPLAEPAGVQPETLEVILQAVAAGKLDTASAAVRIRSLPGL